MKTTVKTKQVFDVEQMINALGNITAGKLGYALARNAKRVEETTDAIRKQLKGSKELQAFRQKRMATIQTIKDPVEAEAAVEKLLDECGVRAELEELQAKETELLDLETEIDWFQIPVSYIPGLNDGDATAAGVLPLAAMKLFVRVGILADTDEPEKPRLEAVKD